MPAPSEWRVDPLTGRRVLLAPARGERPPGSTVGCPFCEGNEHETTKEVFAFRREGTLANQAGWRVRVIPNRFGAVRWYEEVQHDLAHGVAELFIECPHHGTRFEELAPVAIHESLHCWRERLRVWEHDHRLAFVQVFKNQGSFAGASLEHCHSQLIGVQVIPEAMLRECELARGHFMKYARCLTCDWLAHERESERYVCASDNFEVLAPRAARFPGELCIYPKKHEAHFHAISDDELTELAQLLPTLLQQQTRLVGANDYNIVVKSSPFRPETPEYHWRMELLPRTTGIAGWEWGTGVIINTMSPEEVARRLRPE